MDDLLHASAVDAHTAALWRNTPRGVALITDDAGRPITAPDVDTVMRVTTEPVVLSLPTFAERRALQEALAHTRDQPRWHVSPAPGVGFPAAFAWYGPDDLRGHPPTVLHRQERIALWRGTPSQAPVTVAVAALAQQALSAVITPCPPEALAPLRPRQAAAAAPTLLP